MTSSDKDFVIVDKILDNDSKRVIEVVRTRAGRFSVAFLIYDPESDSVILVEQQRMAMVSDDNPSGFIVEVPAGRCDRPESVKAAIAREAEEEVGATIDEDQIEMINAGQPLATSPGVLDELIYLAFIQLRSGQLSADQVFGVAEEGEFITRKLVPAARACDLVCVDLKTKALLLELMRRRIAKIAQGRAL
ncbi:MAG: NUDIX domain-containing protein [Candidatus Pacebacteria bacterium]|nr:NUDIX domain-containing protein [Candidatus Paceibacterota bacterium]